MPLKIRHLSTNQVNVIRKLNRMACTKNDLLQFYNAEPMLYNSLSNLRDRGIVGKDSNDTNENGLEPAVYYLTEDGQKLANLVRDDDFLEGSG